VCVMHKNNQTLYSTSIQMFYLKSNFFSPGKLVTAKSLKNKLQNTNKELPISEKFAHITNITTLLANSNLTAFKTKYKNGFPCFYCSTRFDNLDTLRGHQFVHKNDDIRRFVAKKYLPGRPDCLVVYADVTALKCTICGQDLPNLKELKAHLTKTHNKTMYSNYTDRVIPFKMSNNLYRCQICSFDFETFGSVERHMNTHYRNFVCEECGAGFITKHRLKIHTYALHSRIGTYPCQDCGKNYPTHKKLKLHFDNVHTMTRRIKCPKCPAKFLYYVVRQKHLVDVHGEEPILYRCNVCEKSFKRKYMLSNHIKKDHLCERNLNCELCTFSW
jgi:PR domain zinc finger protein 5